ncbi:MAG: hypothetical protein PCFJNLEI_02953 [Verrucomicrobiae bacterium]|nr:hypothetical protein [Verrucomicrobiae bacterium]
MIFSKIYSNKPKIFPAIRFRRGVNVILARVQNRKDTTKDSHNLGKTLLIDLLDFCLLTQPDREFFLKKHKDRFADFVFFLELGLQNGGYVTIRRSVDEPSKISFKKHAEPNADFTKTPDNEWDHNRLPFDRAVTWLDGTLNLTLVKPWSYRKGCGYFMRKQEDFRDVFQLSRFSKGKDKDWKPYVAHVLGFDSALLTHKYELDEEVEKLRARYAEARGEVNLDESDYDRLKGQIEIKQDEVQVKQQGLDEFDFREKEAGMATELADEVERRIGELNTELYNLRFDLDEAEAGAQTELHFNVSEIDAVFQEAGLFFPDELKHSYEELVSFNDRIIKERRQHLEVRIKELRERLTKAELEHTVLSAKRKEYLSVLNQRDSLKKYKQLQSSLDQDRARLALMKEKFQRLDEMLKLNAQIKKTLADISECSDKIGEIVRSGTERFRDIRLRFAKIIREVLIRKAEPYVRVNDSGNLEFKAEFQEGDQEDTFTSESEGTTYKKFLCMAFDLSVTTACSQEPFFHFIYHDGAFETEDNRRKVQWLSTVRKACLEHELQYILTVIEDDLPRDEKDQKIDFPPDEIVRELHDQGDDGRLFRMARF